jgi:hypothetical protein
VDLTVALLPRRAFPIVAGAVLLIVVTGACGADGDTSLSGPRLEVSQPRPAPSSIPPSTRGGPAETRDFPRARRAREAHPELRPFVPSRLEIGGSVVSGTAPVERVVTGPDGSLGLPEDPGRLGWWAGGSLAATPYGSVVVAGHLDSRTFGLGFAARLSGLRRGDSVVLAGQVRSKSYVVRSVYLLPRARLDALADLFSARGPARLVLLTCGGDYDRAAGAYSHNLVVEAQPVDRSG